VRHVDLNEIMPSSRPSVVAALSKNRGTNGGVSVPVFTVAAIDVVRTRDQDKE